MTKYIRFEKDPDEVLDYQLVWTSRLKTDTITDSEWIIPVGINLDSDSSTTTTTTIWLSGGTLDEVYELLNRITTAGGRVMDQSIKIAIKKK